MLPEFHCFYFLSGSKSLELIVRVQTFIFEYLQTDLHNYLVAPFMKYILSYKHTITYRFPQNKRVLLTCHSHWFSSRGPKPSSQRVSMPEPATAIKHINPSTEDDYDWFGHQIINLYPSHSPTHSLFFVDETNIMRKCQRLEFNNTEVIK